MREWRVNISHRHFKWAQHCLERSNIVYLAITRLDSRHADRSRTLHARACDCLSTPWGLIRPHPLINRVIRRHDTRHYTDYTNFNIDLLIGGTHETFDGIESVIWVRFWYDLKRCFIRLETFRMKCTLLMKISITRISNIT